MQLMLNQSVLIAPAIPIFSNSLFPFYSRTVKSVASWSFISDSSSLRAICGFSATNDLIDIYVARPVFLTFCPPPLSRASNLFNCAVNIVNESGGEEKEKRSFENHLESTSIPFLMIQTQEWLESVADAPFIRFWESNDALSLLISVKPNFSSFKVLLMTKQMKVRVVQRIPVIWPSL